MVPAEKAWVGVDVGKTHHWVCVLDTDGKKVLSVKIANDQAELTAVIVRVGALERQTVWAIDIVGGRQRCCWRCCGRPASLSATRRAEWWPP